MIHKTIRSTRVLVLILGLTAALPALAAEQIPWPEHPRPDFQRSPWVNLNGSWSFQFDPNDVGEKEGWFTPGKHDFAKRITVPFPWESRLSGIGDTEYKGIAWYSREVTLPDGPEWKGKDVWLVIGACDFAAKAWANGQLLGDEHVGGYLPFEFNLAKVAKPGEKVTLTIRAADLTDPQQPTGKQVHWYTRTSGIWQTVYLEPRPRVFICEVRATPDIKKGQIRVEVRCTSHVPADLLVSSPDGGFEETVGSELFAAGWRSDASDRYEVTVRIKDPKLWTPDSPQLYPMTLQLVSQNRTLDRVDSYFGLREVGTAKASGGDYQYITLNGKPIYLRGLLHQSFHPEGIYQYPDDATMRSDYELCKRAGINFVRIHIKVPIPRELYWADKLGVMVMQDMPNVWEHTQQGRSWYQQMLRGAIARDINHPAIFAWVDFNETWGLNNPGPYDAERQQWVEEMYKRTKQLDRTRLVEDNSPCNYDHVATDINSWHFYINDYEAARKHIAEVVEKTHPGSTFNFVAGRTQGSQPLINSEYGGIGAGNGDQDVSWCLKFLTNELRRHDKICGYIYTELSDIEWEHNGLVNYDRSPKEFGYDFWHPGFTLADINSPDFVVLDAPPCIQLKPGETREVPTRISHWSDHQAKALQLRWRSNLYRFGALAPEQSWNTTPVTWKPFQVVDGPKLKASAPSSSDAMLGALQVELVDGATVLARNYVNLWQDAPSPRVEAHDDKIVSLRFNPGDFSGSTWQGQAAPIPTGPAVEKTFGYGSGAIEYRVKLPDGLKAEAVEEIRLLAELSAKSRDEKLDWPARKNVNDCPQSDVKKWPTDVRASINGVGAAGTLVDGPGVAPRASRTPVALVTLPDDPADAAGVLSHVQQYQPGSYGWLVLWVLPKDEARKALQDKRELRVRLEVPEDAEHRGGLAIYGDRMGAFPTDPTVTLLFSSPHGLGARYTSDAPVAIDKLVDRFQTLIPTAEAGGHAWRYTTSRPADDWTKPEFDDTGWKTGKGGFGRRETPNAIIGTRWTTADIWLRTELTVDDPAAWQSASWRLYHDEDVEVFLNGAQVLERPGFVTGYVDVPLETEALRRLRKGANVVAVHCRQTGGGQDVDLGLTAARAAPQRR